jgi:small-conductance mechanosensitive channel
MSRYKIRAIILTAVVCVGVVWTTPVRSQEQEQEPAKDANTPKVEQVEPEKPADPKADEALKQLLKEIGATVTEQSSSERDNATAAVENTEINNNGEEKVAGEPGVVNNQQNLQQKEQELKTTTENLQKITDADSAAKNQLVVTVTELQSQLTAIDDRFNAILEELEKKGGDPKPYRQYAQAVMSIDVDTKDTLGPVFALVGGLSFILAFALQSNLGNIASGLMIMAYKPFDVGDEIKLGELWGWVESITLANTKIKGLDGQMFNVPNNTVWGDTIENLSHSPTRKFTH